MATFLKAGQVGEESQHSIPAKQFTDAERVNVQDRLLSDYHSKEPQEYDQREDAATWFSTKSETRQLSQEEVIIKSQQQAPIEYTSATSPRRATTTFNRDGGRTIESIFRDAIHSTTGTTSFDGEKARQSEKESVELVRDVFVGVYYYPWHADDFHRGDGYLRDQLEERQPPLLGEYDDRERDIIAQHLSWSRRANVRLWVCSWWGPNSREDTTIRNSILPHPDLGFKPNSSHKIALLYEGLGRGLKESAGFDTSNTYEDLVYICENYFRHPNYYYLNEKPVIVLYLSRKLFDKNVLKVVLTDMRKAARDACETELFIIGDHVWQHPPNVNDYWPFTPGKYLDGATNYDVYGNVGMTPYAGSAALDRHWNQYATAWKKFANRCGVAYVPGTSPGYNDRGIRPQNHNPGLSRKLDGPQDEHGTLFAAHLVRARDLVETQSFLSDPLLLVNSFNEWHEDSQIEPVIIDGGHVSKPKSLTNGLEYEPYGLKYLDILRRATCGNDSYYYQTEAESTYRRTSKYCEMARRYAKSSVVATDEGHCIFEFADDMKSAVSLNLQPDPFQTDPPPSDLLVAALYFPVQSDRSKFRSQVGQQEIEGEVDGSYDKVEQSTLERHIEISKQANIGMWIVEWYGTGTLTDDVLKETVLGSDGLGKSSLKVSLLYHARARIPNFRTPTPSNWDWSVVESDIESLCHSDYGIFNHPSYFRIGEKPVLILGITRWFHDQDQLPTLVTIIRNVIEEACGNSRGKGLILIGDQVWNDAPVVDGDNSVFGSISKGQVYAPFQLLDAVVNIDVASNVGRIGYIGKQTVDKFYLEQRKWRDAAWRSNCGYIPSLSPGYNNRASTKDYHSPLLARRIESDDENGSLFNRSLAHAIYLADSTFSNLLVVNSFNGFSEDTQIEPMVGSSSDAPKALTDGIQYEGYGRLFLNILKQRTENSPNAYIQKSGNNDTSAAFYPLRCNLVNQVGDDICDLRWSDLFDVSGEEIIYSSLITIPCGHCIILDCDSFPTGRKNGTIELKFEKGIEISGMLLIPSCRDFKIRILAPFIRVLGEFHILADEVSVDGKPRIELILIDEIDEGISSTSKFFPPSSNTYACGIGRCEPKSRSIFVGGGKINFRGLPDASPISIPSEGIVLSSKREVAEQKDQRCVTGGILFEVFPDGGHNFTRTRNLLISPDVAMDSIDPLSGLLNSRRRLSKEDIRFDVTKIKDCLTANSPKSNGEEYSIYEIVMELRLMNDGSNGEHRTCDTNCVHVFVEYMVDSVGIENQVSTEKEIQQDVSFTYGQWIEFKTTIAFTPEEVSTSNVYLGLKVTSTESNVFNHAIDSHLEISRFRLQQPADKVCGSEINICYDMMPCNGHAEYDSNQTSLNGLGNDVSPVIHYDHNEKNWFWLVKNGGGLSWNIPVECLISGSVYLVSMRVRAFRDESEWNFSLPTLTISDNPSSEVPLGWCEGDCDSDDMCDGQMICFQRQGGVEVPYCNGGAKSKSRTDFCTFPESNLSVRIDESDSDSLLGFCEGDCDSDDDCLDGLTCYQRNGNEEVPFCLGGRDDGSRTDYCIPFLEMERIVKLSVFLIRHKVEGEDMIERIALCHGEIDTWADCYGSFRVGESDILQDINPNDIFLINITAIDESRGTDLSYGVDDISVKLSKGSEKLVVDETQKIIVTKTIKEFWLPGSRISLTPGGSSVETIFRTIFHVEPYVDDRVLISLDTPVEPWPPHGWAMDKEGFVVTLLSRNIAIEGMLTIYRTPKVSQVVNGTEFRVDITNSESIPQVIHFDHCKQNEVSIITNNVVVAKGSRVSYAHTLDLVPGNRAVTTPPN